MAALFTKEDIQGMVNVIGRIKQFVTRIKMKSRDQAANRRVKLRTSNTYIIRLLLEYRMIRDLL